MWRRGRGVTWQRGRRHGRGHGHLFLLRGAGVSRPWAPCLVVVISPSSPLPLVVPPTNHPTSSCSWGWGWVVLWLVVVVPPQSLSLPFHQPSTPRAVARGAGGGWCVVVVSPLVGMPGCCPSFPIYPLSSSPFHIPLVYPPLHRSTHQPPHEQLLVRLGWAMC